MNKLNFITSFDGTKVFYRAKIKGKKTIVFLHGTGRNHLSWKPYYIYFEKLGFSTITPDLRGFGKSLGNNLSIESCVEDLNEILKTEKIDKAILVGHCFGSSIAVDFSRKYREKVEKMVLLTIFTKSVIIFPGLIYAAVNLFYYMGKLFSKLRIKRSYVYAPFENYKKLPSFIMPFVDFRRCSFVNWFLSVKITMDYNLRLDNINKPLAIIIGERDFFLNRNKIKNSIVLKGVDHTVISRKPKELFGLLGKIIC